MGITLSVPMAGIVSKVYSPVALLRVNPVPSCMIVPLTDAVVTVESRFVSGTVNTLLIPSAEKDTPNPALIKLKFS
jgi:hypothetical protein